MRAQLVHLKGPLRGRTITHGAPRIVFGTAADADVRYPPGWKVAERHAHLFFVEAECEFHLAALDGEVFVNQRQITEVILRDEDLIELGVEGPKLRFRAHVDPGRVCKPVRKMLRDARDVGRVNGLLSMSRAFTGDLILLSTRRARVVMLVTLLTVFGLAWLGGWLGGRGPARKQRAEEAERAQLYEREFARLEERIAAFASREELDVLRADLERRALVVDELVARNQALQQVLETYSRGVCLIYGAYTFQSSQSGVLVPVTGPAGQPIELEFVGSGFLATAEGHVVTNRHVAEPWWNDRTVEALIQRGLQPTFTRLLVCFPGKLPVPVDPASIRLSQEGVDLAVLHVAIEDVPVLPLEEGDVAAFRGERIVLLGYPTGIHAILARSERDLVTAVLARATDTPTLLMELAREDAIHPVITQGALNEVRERRLVYDAETTSGGSGGPVFARHGRVIGVNFAITRDFDGSNFGVPVAFVHALLR